jgi:hypothetical protein
MAKTAFLSNEKVSFPPNRPFRAAEESNISQEMPLFFMKLF